LHAATPCLTPRRGIGSNDFSGRLGSGTIDKRANHVPTNDPFESKEGDRSAEHQANPTGNDPDLAKWHSNYAEYQTQDGSNDCADNPPAKGSNQDKNEPSFRVGHLFWGHADPFVWTELDLVSSHITQTA
jgi:hypothetical protein